MRVYIIWDKKGDRPLVGRDNFGPVLVYPSLVQAQAMLKDLEVYVDFDYCIKEADLKVDEFV